MCVCSFMCVHMCIPLYVYLCLFVVRTYVSSYCKEKFTASPGLKTVDENCQDNESCVHFYNSYVQTNLYLSKYAQRMSGCTEQYFDPCFLCHGYLGWYKLYVRRSWLIKFHGFLRWQNSIKICYTDTLSCQLQLHEIKYHKI